MEKGLDLEREIRESIIDGYTIIEPENFTKWLEELMKEFYDYNQKTFMTLTEKETDIFRKVFCEEQKTSTIGKEYNVTPCNITEIIRRKKREIIKRIGVMYRLQTNKDTCLENTLLWPTTVEELSRTGLKRMSDITKLSEREFEMITSFIPPKVRIEVLNMMKTYKIEFEGLEIVIEEDDIFIDELGLKSYTLKSLFWSGVRTKSQIMNLSKDDLKKIVGLGKDGLKEIMDLFEKENKEIKETSNKNIIVNRETPIERLNLNTRTLQALYRNNIRTLDDLFKVPAAKLKCMKGIGTKSFYELLERIRYIGYEFPEEDKREEYIEKIEDSEMEKEYLLFIAKHKQKILKIGDK